MAAEALVFDAYGTLFDVHSVAARCESCWPGKGAQLSLLWRAKQLEYTWQRSLMQRYVPFSTVTREALAYACDALGLALMDRHLQDLMGEYLRLSVYPDAREALERLKTKKAILSNGSPDMLGPLVQHSGLRFDEVISVDEVKIYKPDTRTTVTEFDWLFGTQMFMPSKTGWLGPMPTGMSKATEASALSFIN